MTWRRIGEEAGFPGGSVTALVQDRRGLIWIGASGGLFRYDGHGFGVFGREEGARGGDALSTSAVACLAEDSRGDIWVGTTGSGLFRRRASGGGFDRIDLGGARNGRSLPLRISALAADPTGNILAGTEEGGLYMSDSGGRVFMRLESPGRQSEAVTAICADSSGRIWTGTSGGGLARYDSDGNLVARYLHDRGRPDSIGSDRILAVIEDSLASIWIGLDSPDGRGGSGGADLFHEGSFRHAAAAAPATALAEDPRGRIWVGLGGGGIGVLDPSRMEIESGKFADGAGVTRLMHDRRGLLWAGLERGGLVTGDIRSAEFARLTATATGEPLGAALAVAQSRDGRIFAAGRDSGLAVFDPVNGSLRPFGAGKGSAASGAVMNGVARLRPWTIHAADDGFLWLGGPWPGLVRVGAAPGAAADAKAFPGSAGSDGPHGHDSRDRQVIAILADGRGGLIVGTRGAGIERFDPVSGRFTPEPNGPDGRSVSCLARDRNGGIWAGTKDSGLAVLEPGASIWLGVDPGIGDLDVESLLADERGLLWVGTGGAGLAAIDLATKAIVLRGRDSGIGADRVLALARDGSGGIWASTSLGLYAFDPDRRTSFLYGAEDGLCDGALQPGALLAAADGQIWAGSEAGMASFDPRRVPRYGPAPEVAVSELWSASEKAQPDWKADGSGLSLAHDNAGLGFGIAVIDYLAPGRNRYAMRLEGRNPSWIQLGAMNSGYIAPLPPGSYMLRVKAAGANGIWNDYGAAVAVTVRPPWWGTWWFRLAGAISILAGSAAAVAARLGALGKRNALLVRFASHIEEAREEERTMAAREVHDEIGQHLTVLSFHAYWLATHPAGHEEERTARIGEMREAIRQAMDAVKAVAGRLRPGALDTLDLPDALRLSLRSFGKMSGMETDFELGSGWESMSRECAGVAFRILQEALGNAARHSGARRVRVRLFREGDAAVLEVDDDGKGIEAARIDAPDSFGIIGMRERCAAVGGGLEIGAAPGGGCAVIARLPVRGV